MPQGETRPSPAELPPAGEVASALARVVGEEHVVTDRDLLARAATDWTGRFRGWTPAIVRPGDTDEVAAVVSWCSAHGVAVVVQGGNTSLVGGAVPLGGEMVLSTARLAVLGALDAGIGQVTAGAGVTLETLQGALGGSGWRFAVDMASRATATVGGMVATNAGGIHVVRHGSTRAQLVGLEAVLGDGSVISHLGGLVKDNTGYELAALLCGSEGTLGIVTAARLRLVPDPALHVSAVLSFESVGAAVGAANALRRDLPELEAAELMLGAGVELVCHRLKVAAPFDPLPPVMLLVEAAGERDPTDTLSSVVERLKGVIEVAVAGVDSPARRAALWRLRDGHSDAIAAAGVAHKLDVSLPAGSMEPFVAAVERAVAQVRPEAKVWIFGHVADGNLHVNVTGVEPDDDVVDEVVLETTARMGGSISAEHGIGSLKRRWLHLARSPAEIAAFRALKRALDPAGVLNPGVLLPPEG